MIKNDWIFVAAQMSKSGLSLSATGFALIETRFDHSGHLSTNSNNGWWTEEVAFGLSKFCNRFA